MAQQKILQLEQQIENMNTGKEGFYANYWTLRKEKLKSEEDAVELRKKNTQLREQIQKADVKVEGLRKEISTLRDEKARVEEDVLVLREDGVGW